MPGLLPLNSIHQWHILNPIRPGESPFAALARTIWAIADLPTTVQLDSLSFLSERLNQKIEELQPKIAEASKKDRETSRITQRLKQEAEKFAQIIATWNHDSHTAKQLLIVEHFETLYALCSTETESESQQQQQLKQVFLACLNPLTARLQSAPNSFVEIVKTWSQKQPGVKLLLVIDQFEELITLGRKAQPNQPSNTPEEWQQFLQLLETTLAATLPQLRIIVTLRSDFEPRFLNSEALKSYWTRSRFPVRAMRSDELRQAIAAPASEMALYFEPANLVDRLIDEVGQMPGALPLLSFTLSEFYIKLVQKWRNKKTSDRALTIDADFDKEGGVAGSLTRKANEEYNKIGDELDEAAQITMRRVMLRMLTLEGGETARRRVPESELVYPTKEESDRVKQVVDRLVEARLLVKGQLETGEPYVEAAHDFLVRGWGTLQDWIDEEKLKETLELQQRLTVQANDWSRNNSHYGLLLPDSDRLKRLEQILELNDSSFNQREIEYVNRSIKQAKKIRAKPQLLQKANKVQSLLSVQPLESLVLAIESIGQNLEELQEPILSQVQFGLYKAVEGAREQVRFNASGQDIRRSVISHNGDYLLTHNDKDVFLQLWSIQGTVVNGYKNVGDNPVPIWEVNGIKIHYELQLDNDNLSITSFSFSIDDKQIIVGDTNGVISFWDFQGNSAQKPFKAHLSPIRLLETHLTKLLVSVSDKGFIGVWNYQGDPVCKPFRAHDEINRSSKIAISPNGCYIASNHQEELKIWDLHGNLIYELSQDKEKLINLIGFSSDDEIIIVRDAGLKKIRFQSRETIDVFMFPKKYNQFIVDLSRELIAGITAEEHLEIFDWHGSLVGQPLKIDKKIRNYSLSFHPKFLSLLVLTGNYTQPMKLWDLRDTQIIKPIRNHTGRISSITFTPDGQYIVSAGQAIYSSKDKQSEDKTVCLWDLSGNLIYILKHDFGVSAITCSKDSQFFASLDSSIWVWDCRGELIIKFPNTIKDIQIRNAAIAFSQDSQEIVVAELNGGVSITVWNRKGSLINQSFQDHGRAAVMAIAISPNAELILVGGDWTQIINRDANTVAELKGGHKEPNTRVIAVAFSPNGYQVVTGGFDKSIQLWSCQGAPIGSAFTGHQALISALAFSQDGNYIASGDGAGVILLWDLKGNPIAEFHGHEGAISAITFSPDGYTLVSGGSDRSVRLWKCRWESWLELACDRLRYHTVFTDPESIEDLEQREIAIAACETCQKYVWNKEDTSV